MKKKILITLLFIGTLASLRATATPPTPIIQLTPQTYSLININLESKGSYKSIVSRKENVPITIKWNSKEKNKVATHYKVFFDEIMVHQSKLPENTSDGIITFPYGKSGRHQLTLVLCDVDTLEQCDVDSCRKSSPELIIIADTDGKHLEPLTMHVNPNNGDFKHTPDTVVAAHFIEWGVYVRDFDVTKVPAKSLTHILYNSIPICGINNSHKMIEGGDSLQMINTACADSKNYEIVILDPWAALQKPLPGIDSNSPVQGTYSQLMALKQRHPDLKILPSIGGWSLSDPFFELALKSNRDIFVASVKDFLKTWKFFDGIEIDWQYPGGGADSNLGDPENDGDTYVVLMQELHTMLNELETETGKTYQLTSAIGATIDRLEDVNYVQAQAFVDYFFVTAYDFFGGWNDTTGHHASLFCGAHISQEACDGDESHTPEPTADNAIKHLIAEGVIPEKLVMGTAMYGRGWEGVFASNASDINNPMTALGDGKLQGTYKQGIWTPGFIDYKAIKSWMPGKDSEGIDMFKAGYDEQAEAAYIWNAYSGKLVSYDSPRSVTAKGKYVRENNLGGLFSWSIDADNGDLLNAMHKGLASKKPKIEKPVVEMPVVRLRRKHHIRSEGNVTIKTIATDSSSNPLAYKWILDSDLANLVKALEGTESDTLIFEAPSVEERTVYTLSVEVSNGKTTMTKKTRIVIHPRPEALALKPLNCH